MKKLGLGWLVVIFSVLLTVAVAPVQAQDNKWSIGVKGGATLPTVFSSSNQILNTNLPTSTPLRYTGGVAVQYLTEKNFGLQVEFNYVQKGWKETFSGPDGRIPGKYYQVSLDYAELPVLAHGYFGKRNLRLFINAGVYLGYLLSYDTERANIVDANEIVLPYEERFQNKADFGVRGGGGVEVVTKVGMFQAEGSYSFGLNSVMDKNVTEIPNIVQNAGVAITLGYFVQF